MFESLSIPSGVLTLRARSESVRLSDWKLLFWKPSEQAAIEDVAAITRNHVQTDSAARDVGRGTRCRVNHFLAHRAVEIVLHGAVAVEAVDHQTVDLHGRLRRAEAMRRHVGLLHGARATDVRDIQRDTRDELTHALDGSPGGNGVERFSIEDLRLRGALDVDGRCRTSHRQGSLRATQPSVAVDGRDEVRRQLDTLAFTVEKPSSENVIV